MTKWLAMLITCLALGFVLAACGSDDEGEGGAADTGQAEPTGGAEEHTGEAGGKTVEVSMKDFKFNPGSITVDKGATVKWTNDDSAGHDVTKTGGPGPDFSSGDPGGLNPGDTYEETLHTAGTIDYVCTVHADMKASITVR